MTGINYTLHLAGNARAHTGALPPLAADTATPQTVSGSRFGEALRDSLHLVTHGAGIALPAAGAVAGGMLGARIARATQAAGRTSHFSGAGGVAAGVALVTAGALAWNLLRQPGIPASQLPPTTRHPLAPGNEHARVMTFNVRYGLGADYGDYIPTRRDMDQVAAAIEREHPDIVMLQEVHDFGAETGFVDQFASLNRRLHPDGAVFAPAGRDVIGKSDGNAVLTFNGYTIDDARALNFPQGAGEQARGVADVDIVSPGGRHVRVLTTHLEANGEAQTRQYGSLGKILEAGAGSPTIISGDWNTSAVQASGKLESRVFGAVGLTDAFTAVGLAPDDPLRASFGQGGHSGIDRIYTGGGVSVEAAQVVREANPSSDHQPVIAEVTL